MTTTITTTILTTTMSDAVPTTIDNVIALLQDAWSLLAEAGQADSEVSSSWKGDAEVWRDELKRLFDGLSSRRNSLRDKIMLSLSQARALDPTQLQFSEVEAIGEELLTEFDRFAEQLPFVRPASLIALDQGAPEEALAAAIYEVSAKVGTETATNWSEAPSDIRQVLTETASQLLSSGVIVFGAKLKDSKSECNGDNFGRCPKHPGVNYHARDISEPIPAGARGMHVDPRQVPTDLKEPAMEAGQPSGLPPNIKMPEFAEKGESDDE
jgi:hypothetical protein